MLHKCINCGKWYQDQEGGGKDQPIAKFCNKCNANIRPYCGTCLCTVSEEVRRAVEAIIDTYRPRITK